MARVRFVDEDQVIRGSRADFRGDSRPAAQRELVGVNARLHPVPLAASRMSRDSSGREHALLAEDVAPFGETLFGNRRDHHVDELLDVGAALAAEFDRDFVRAHERRGQIDRLSRRRRS
jgi:hypothetical protein